MSQTLKKIVNQSLHQLPKSKVVNSISELCTDAVNKSFEYQSESQNSLENEELLRMEIKQLKRENAFLKGKIQQMKNGKPHLKPQLHKKQSLNCINILKKRLPAPKNISNQNSLSFILNEIQTILKSLAAVYKMQCEDKGWFNEEGRKQQQNCEQETDCYLIEKQFKQKLNKKLQMISLQKEQSRYGSILDVFSSFYSMKMEDEKRIKQKIENYIEKTIQISRKLIQRFSVRANQKGLKSSCIYTMNPPVDQNEAQNLSNINDSYVFSQFRVGNLQKHELSYSTIDGQNICRQID